ncbi:MAG: cysteine synthase A [Myxococcales bacterium]|nr:cysteine synthase A [Myxococcales bacterium]
MQIHENIISAIGNTPIIKLRKASEATGCTILGKAEFMNPGQSVKDRAALSIILEAAKSGQLSPGGTIVEGTAGNTGIGLAMVGGALGYRTVIVIPETQSEEKKAALRLAGAELIQVPAKPYRDPMNYVKYSGRLAEKLHNELPNGAIWANQFDNRANFQAHYQTTGPEIWRQTNGNIDGFICSIGSGGTLNGVATYLREQSASVQIGLADPMGAALFSYYAHGVLKSEGSSVTEGIGQGRITKNIEDLQVDHPFQVTDTEALEQVFDIAAHEGMVLGGSAGLNVAGAIKLARTLGPGKTIVTVLCDYGQRYQSKIFNPEFLKAKGLPVPHWLVRDDQPMPLV